MRKLFLIASFSGISAPARRGGPAPHPANHLSLITRHCLTSFLFDTNKAHRIMIPMRAPLKTKEKQFSIQYKFAHCGTATVACPERTRRVCALRSWVRALRYPEQNKCAQARLPMLPVPRGTNHQSLLTDHQSPITTRYTNAPCLGVPVMLTCPAAWGQIGWRARTETSATATGA